MFAKSQALGGLVTAMALAASVAALAVPATAAPSCTPPAGADTWYCTAVSLSDTGVTDRQVDDYFRDVNFASPMTSNGIVDDSWRSPFVVETTQPSSSGFDWGDFGIGAAVAVGAMLLAIGIAARFGGRRRAEVRSA